MKSTPRTSPAKEREVSETAAFPPMTAFVRLPTILAAVPISKSQLWEMIRRQEFPRPVNLSARVRAWRVADIEAWIDSRVSACC